MSSVHEDQVDVRVDHVPELDHAIEVVALEFASSIGNSCEDP